MFRLPLGAQNLEDPSVLQTLFKTVYRSILASPIELRKDLCQHIVLSGTFPENFGSALEANMTACLSQQNDDGLSKVWKMKEHPFNFNLPPNTHKLQVSVDANGADALSVWIGLSIMGSLSDVVHKKPIIEEGAIGVYMTASEFLQFGPDFIFTRDPTVRQRVLHHT